MSIQRGLSDWGIPEVDRDDLLDELHRLDSLEGEIDAELVADESDYQLRQFRDEFGSVVAGLQVAGIVADPDDLDLPAWARSRYYALVIPELRVAAGHRWQMPEWAEGYDELVVRGSANSRKHRHGPALDADEPTPRCDLRHRTGGSYTAAEAENIKGFYDECQNAACQAWFAASGSETPQRALCYSPGDSSPMTDGGGR